MYRNNFYLGLGIGAVLPAITWIVFNYVAKDMVIMNKPAVPYLIAIAINLILVRVFHRKQADQTSRGIIVITFAFMILVFLTRIRL